MESHCKNKKKQNESTRYRTESHPIVLLQLFIATHRKRKCAFIGIAF